MVWWTKLSTNHCNHPHGLCQCSVPHTTTLSRTTKGGKQWPPSDSLLHQNPAKGIFLYTLQESLDNFSLSPSTSMLTQWWRPFLSLAKNACAAETAVTLNVCLTILQEVYTIIVACKTNQQISNISHARIKALDHIAAFWIKQGQQTGNRKNSDGNLLYELAERTAKDLKTKELSNFWTRPQITSPSRTHVTCSPKLINHLIAYSRLSDKTIPLHHHLKRMVVLLPCHH